MSAILLRRLKIADLAAWTALDTGRRLLPPGHVLDRLVREDLFVFEPAVGFATDIFETPLAAAIERSNFFVNPSKERYRFLTAAGRGDALAPPEGAWGILTRARDESREDGLRARLLREHPLEGLGTIRRARIWWIWTLGPGGDQAIDACFEAIGPVGRIGRGLLFNPHAEAELRIEHPIPWRSIEAFLTAPAPALRSAA